MSLYGNYLIVFVWNDSILDDNRIKYTGETINCDIRVVCFTAARYFYYFSFYLYWENI